MGFKIVLLGDAPINMIDFGHGDVHIGFLEEDKNVLSLSEGRIGNIGEDTGDEYIDDSSLKSYKALLMRFTKHESVDILIKQLQIIKQNLIENGK